MLAPLEIAKLCAKTMDDKLGRDIKILKTAELTTLADYFVICSATSTTQIKTLADAVEAALETAGEQIHHREGYRDGGWVLLDYSSVVVHIFNDETRDFYKLEHKWADAEEVSVD
ncbi:MAG: ribosome silencing factor [Oscillospiraceae bacterium]|nr:ribosome silencing factor [Oscillospiraceae bacterium]